MNLKTIAVSQDNYEALRNFGKAGMSFNDVISDLITKVCNGGGGKVEPKRSS